MEREKREAPNAHPLEWPPHIPRTADPQKARFGTPFAQARDGAIRELELMGAENVVVSTNVPLRQDGLPYASAKEPDDPAVAVYAVIDGEQRVFACDQWTKLADNMQAIRKTIGALRGIERWGGHNMQRAVFTGFKALPEEAGDVAGAAWWHVLGVSPDAGEGEIRQAFRKRATAAHPDAGGSRAEWGRLHEAKKQALEATHQKNDTSPG